MEINKIYQWDCMDILKDIPTESIDCVITDCPYKIIAWWVRIVNEWDECSWVLQKRDYSKTDPKLILGRGKIIISDWSVCSNKWLKKWQTNIPSAVKDWKMFDNNDIEFSEWLPEVYRVLKQWTHCYIMINARNLKDLQVEAEKVWFEFQNLLAWDKWNATPNKYYMQCLEFVLLLRKWPARNINDMGSINKLDIPNIIGTKIHPTEKPIELIKIFVKNSTNENELVLDPFAWWWSTCIASKQLNRNYIGIEIDEQFVDVINKRLSEWVMPLF